MNAEQLQTAALAAIRAMDEATRLAFIAMIESGNDEAAATVAQAFALEGINRQIRLAHMAMESSSVMGNLTEAVYDRISA